MFYFPTNQSYFRNENENEKSCQLKWHNLHLIKSHHQDCVQRLDQNLTAVEHKSADMAPAMPHVLMPLETEVDCLQIQLVWLM